MASQSQILRLVAPAALFGDDVLHVNATDFVSVLRVEARRLLELNEVLGLFGKGVG